MANIAQAEALLLGGGADLLVLPELANSGYLYAAPEGLRALLRAGRRVRAVPGRAGVAWRAEPAA